MPGLFQEMRLVIKALVISNLACTFLAFLCWMAVMTKFDVSYAYPFVGFSFVLIPILSVLFLTSRSLRQRSWE